MATYRGDWSRWQWLSLRNLELPAGASEDVSAEHLAPIRDEPQSVLSLRLHAADVLSSYAILGRTPPAELLRHIVGVVVAVPELPNPSPTSDLALSAFLQRFGVEGVECRAASIMSAKLDMRQLFLATRSLAVPGIESSEKTWLATQQTQLWEETVLAILELDTSGAAAGLRWLSIFSPGKKDRADMIDALDRIRELALDNWQVQFDCASAEIGFARVRRHDD